MAVDRTDHGARAARRWPLLLGVLGALVLLVAGGMWIGWRVAEVTSARPEDADLAAARAEVERAAAKLDEAVAIARAHHEQIAIPVRDLVVAHSEEFSQDVADVLHAAVELSVESVTDYHPLSAAELADDRTQVAREVARLVSLAEDQQDATLKVRAALQSVDETIYAALTVAEGIGSETAQALTHSSEEASAFTLAVDHISELTAVEVHDASWTQRTVERPSVLGDEADPDELSQGTRTPSVVEAVETYLETARAARASHALHAADPVDQDPDPEPEPAGDPGGGSGGSGGGGGAGYACYKWGLYGGYVGWCY